MGRMSRAQLDALPPRWQVSGQEPWKAPLPQFIEYLYTRRFGRKRLDTMVSIEERAGRAGHGDAKAARRT